MQLLIFTPMMAPLAHIHTYVDDTAAQGWSNQGSVSMASAVGPILREIALSVRLQRNHASVRRVPGEENNMADAALRLTHLPDRQFLSHFFSHFLQSNPWRLTPPAILFQASATKILHSKISPRASTLQYSRKTRPPRANDSASADDCTLPLTLKASNTQFPSSRFSRSVSMPDFYLCRIIPSRSYWSNNTSDPLVKSYHTWGPTTHAIAPW